MNAFRVSASILVITILLGTLIQVIGCGPHPPASTTYTLTMPKVGNGSTNPAVGASAYGAGTVVTVTATPDSGWLFSEWSGDASGTSANTTVTMNSNKTVTATFTSAGSAVPIEVRLDYFGIRWNHQDPTDIFAPWKTQLYVVVDDGKTSATFRYPDDDEGLTMDSFHVEDLGHQRLFYTSSVGDYLKISVIACSSEDKETKLAIWSALEALGQPGAGMGKQIYENLPQQSARVGYWEQYWSSTEKWGTDPGRYDGAGNEDLQVWMRIWSDNEPEAVAEPSITPRVGIESVTLCSNCTSSPAPRVRSKSECYLNPVTLWGDTIWLKNDESCPVTVHWVRSSSNNRQAQTGGVDKANPGYGDVTVPAKGTYSFVPLFWYVSAGDDTVTYTISYGGTQLSPSWSGTMVILPAQDGSASWNGC